MPEEPLSPITEYGRQKAEVERRISKLGSSVSIVRFTKILGQVYPLFSSWLKTLQENKPIHPFSDMYMAPVDLVEPVEASKSGYSSAFIPTNTTLNIDRLKSILGVEPPDTRWTITTAFQTLQVK